MEKKLPASFYQTEGGTVPVREWLRRLDPADRRRIGEDIKEIEFDWPVGMPVCRSLRGGLWEVRSRISGGRIARLLFCIHEGRMVIPHGFVKKTRQTPKPDLDLAMSRKRDVEG